MEYSIPDWDTDEFTIVSTSKYRKHTVTRYHLPDVKPVLTNHDPIKIDVYYHRPDKPMLIAHPVFGSKNNEVVTKFVRMFCRLGWNGAIIHRARHPMEGKTPEEYEALLQNIIFNDIQVSQFLQAHKLMTPDKVISFGASLGGVTNTLLTSTVPYKGYINMVAGGSIATIMARSQDEDISQWREDRIRELGYRDADELEKKYLQAIQTDTLKLANPNARVLMFNAWFDKVVPVKTQRKLVKAFGRKNKTMWLPSGHESIALFLPIIVPVMLIWCYATLKQK